jgi:hypothetical protein
MINVQTTPRGGGLVNPNRCRSAELTKPVFASGKLRSAQVHLGFDKRVECFKFGLMRSNVTHLAKTLANRKA